MNRRFTENLGAHIWPVMLAIVVLAFICALVVLSMYAFHFSGEITTTHERWGTFGDYVGGILNPAFSFLALIALLLTITLQSSELRTTREELELTRKAQEKSEKALSEQSDTLKRQLEEAKRASNAEYFFRAIDRIQSDQTRQARRHLFSLAIDRETPFTGWKSEDVASAEHVCQTYDLVGMMLRHKMVEPSLIIPSWYMSIIKSWESAADLVVARRKVEGDDFWRDFEWLYSRSTEFRENQPDANESFDDLEVR